jgi:hypothetical protein
MSDTRIRSNEIDLLKGTIGQKLIKYRHDPFFHTPTFSIQGEVFFSNAIFKIKCDEHPYDFFEAGKEDISALSFSIIKEDEAVSAAIGIKQLDFPVNEEVHDIWIVEDSIQEYVKEALGQTYQLTRGIVFILDDCQLAFEKDIWLSVEIIPHRGKEVLSKFDPLGNDLEGWPKGCMSKNKRTVYSLLDGRIVSEEKNETYEDPDAD